MSDRKYGLFKGLPRLFRPSKSIQAKETLPPDAIGTFPGIGRESCQRYLPASLKTLSRIGASSATTVLAPSIPLRRMQLSGARLDHATILTCKNAKLSTLRRGDGDGDFTPLQLPRPMQRATAPRHELPIDRAIVIAASSSCPCVRVAGMHRNERRYGFVRSARTAQKRVAAWPRWLARPRLQRAMLIVPMHCHRSPSRCSRVKEPRGSVSVGVGPATCWLQVRGRRPRRRGRE